MNFNKIFMGFSCFSILICGLSFDCCYQFELIKNLTISFLHSLARLNLWFWFSIKFVDLNFFYD